MNTAGIRYYIGAACVSLSRGAEGGRFSQSLWVEK